MLRASSMAGLLARRRHFAGFAVIALLSFAQSPLSFLGGLRRPSQFRWPSSYARTPAVQSRAEYEELQGVPGQKTSFEEFFQTDQLQNSLEDLLQPGKAQERERLRRQAQEVEREGQQQSLLLSGGVIVIIAVVLSAGGSLIVDSAPGS